MEGIKYPEHLVFGLDIGTRSLVGTVGYKENEHLFKVVAQCSKEHETRAMLDGQIHDIPKVAASIEKVKHILEEQTGTKLTEVCIAAAGRVLKTVTAKAEYEFQSETIVLDEHIHSLDLLAVEKAYQCIREETENESIPFYCVAYTPIRYYLNDFQISNLEGHKANRISTELLATFLPEEVIDGLYASVERAGLSVANLTLEPIAAINVAIPEKFRLLNIALVDVGAGTSDISITKDGSIIAYGMIPHAGDEITEILVQKYLVEFKEAEKIKIEAGENSEITYTDIMGLSHQIKSEEVLEAVNVAVQKITTEISEKILELNGDKPVSAVFVVGGGGKIPGFVQGLAEGLSLVPERVALRGEEVLGEVEFLQEDCKKDPLLVTPIGICLNYYDQKNNFIFVTVNGERVKLYDNSKLTIMDAAILIGYPNEKLFPRRGRPINFTLDGAKRLIRGELGEAAVINLNGKEASINSPIAANDRIEITESTTGADAEYEIMQLPEYSATIQFTFNGKHIMCPKFVMANNELVSGFYNIKDQDEIHILNYYTLEQVLEFMDIEYRGQIEVNNVLAALSDKVYENFTIDCDIIKESDKIAFQDQDIRKEALKENISISREDEEVAAVQKEIIVAINGEPVKLYGKNKYIFVDIFEFYPFDLNVAKGTSLVTTVNGKEAEFTAELHEEDQIGLYWKE